MVSIMTGYREISFAQARALSNSPDADFAIYLPSAGGGLPVLYREEAAGMGMPDFERMQAGGMDALLIHTEDVHKCERLVEARLGELLQSPDVPVVEKAGVLNAVGTAVARDLIGDHGDPVQIDRVLGYVNNGIDGLFTDPTISGYVLRMAEHERTIASHLMLVSVMATMLGVEVYGEDCEALRDLGVAGMLHDLGKLAISPKILQKSTPLTHDESLMIQQHPVEAVRLIGENPNVSQAARQMILQHHERIDGQGYPVGVSGPDLSTGSRILAIVDSFHAMLGRQLHRPAQTAAEANRTIERQAGKHFDPDLVACWVALFSRHWDTRFEERRIAPSNDVVDASSRHEHSTIRAGATLLTPYPTRMCHGKATIKCFYSGRLEDTGATLDEFVAPIHDMSRGGVTIYTAHSIYPAEVLNVRIKPGTNELWMRGTVVSCSQQAPHIYKVGVRFEKRLASDELRERVAVRSMHELGALQSVHRDRDDGEVRNSPQHPKTSVQSALESLDAISSTRRISTDEINSVVILSMSGDAEVRMRAVDTLSRIHTHSAQQTLIQMLNDPQAPVRRRAVQAVGALGLTGAGDRILELLDDDNAVVADEAAGVYRTLTGNHPQPAIASNPS